MSEFSHMPWILEICYLRSAMSCHVIDIVEVVFLLFDLMFFPFHFQILRCGILRVSLLNLLLPTYYLLYFLCLGFLSVSPDWQDMYSVRQPFHFTQSVRACSFSRMFMQQNSFVFWGPQATNILYFLLQFIRVYSSILLCKGLGSVFGVWGCLSVLRGQASGEKFRFLRQLLGFLEVLGVYCEALVYLCQQ